MNKAFLKKFFNFFTTDTHSRQPSHENLNQASAYWNQWQQQKESQNLEWVDWGDHPTILRLIYQSLFDSAAFPWINDVPRWYLAKKRSVEKGK